jgi:hypothetical protein
MKKLLIILLLGSLNPPLISVAQDSPPAKQIQPSRTASSAVIGGAPVLPAAANDFPKFDLDFPGGTPGDLVKAIQKATGSPLNAIIPDEHVNEGLPALKLKGVIVPQLFEALDLAGRTRVPYVTAYSGFGGQMAPQYQFYTTASGFKTQGQPRPDSVWYFYTDGPPPEPPKPELVKSCRFYQLAPYLEQFTIEDITTAVETAWKMLGEKSMPELKFHKDTKLLIAVGVPDKLALIDSVLQALPRGPEIDSGTGLPPFKSPKPAVKVSPGVSQPAPAKPREPTKP